MSDAHYIINGCIRLFLLISVMWLHSRAKKQEDGK